MTINTSSYHPELYSLIQNVTGTIKQTEENIKETNAKAEHIKQRLMGQAVCNKQEREEAAKELTSLREVCIREIINSRVDAIRESFQQGKYKVHHKISEATLQNPPKMCSIGTTLFLGPYRGHTKDEEQAKVFYTEAAQKKYPEAMAQLGAMHTCSFGGRQDHKAAFKWYQEGAKAGYSFCMLSLAQAYNQGQGVEKNGLLSIYWCTKAAVFDEQAAEVLKTLIPDSTTAYKLGEVFYYGTRRMPQDIDVAYVLFKKASEANIIHAHAEYYLAMIHFQGTTTIPKDENQASYHLNRAFEMRLKALNLQLTGPLKEITPSYAHVGDTCYVIKSQAGIELPQGATVENI